MTLMLTLWRSVVRCVCGIVFGRCRAVLCDRREQQAVRRPGLEPWALNALIPCCFCIVVSVGILLILGDVLQWLIAMNILPDGTPSVTALAKDGPSRMVALAQCHDEWFGATKTK
eukprot:SAG11_NODE_577_length_8382_cov_36.300374_2_plen_115_part_00